MTMTIIWNWKSITALGFACALLVLAERVTAEDAGEVMIHIADACGQLCAAFRAD